MVKKFYATVQCGVKGYNPPEYYRTLNSIDDATRFRNDFNTSPTVARLECHHSLDNNMGRVVLQSNNPIRREVMNFILIECSEVLGNTTVKTFYVGVVDTVNNVSAKQIEITYTIDWFTSYALNYWDLESTSSYNLLPTLTAGTVLYRRLTGGEFDYKDEDFIAKKLTARTIQANCTANDRSFFYFDENNERQSYDPYDGNLFADGPNDYKWAGVEYIVYHDSKTNRTIKCIAVGLMLNLNNTTDLITFLRYFGINYSGGDDDVPDPSGLLFKGYIPIPGPIAIRGHKRMSPAYADTMFGIYYIEGDPILSTPFYIYSTESIECTEYNRLRIEGGDGAIYYDIPLGNTLDTSVEKDENGAVIESNGLLKVSAYLSQSLNTPVLTLKIDNDNWKQSSTTITLPIYTNVFILDSYNVYRAQERTYQISMLSLQSQNELINGIIGGVNQGAMISAFSRNTTSTGISKGVIGGGLAVIGAGANYSYQTMYANKKATEITDKYNRCKPDVLAQDGYLDSYLISTNSGIRCYSYDDATIANIRAYQARFGYQTQKIENNVNLKAFTGYVQADIIFATEERTDDDQTVVIGLRTEVERYIKEMFNYGVWFTHIPLNEE